MQRLSDTITTFPLHRSASATRPKSLLVGMDSNLLYSVWGTRQRSRLGTMVDLGDEVWNGKSPSSHHGLNETEVIFSTWGMPCLGHRELDLLPRLRAVFYAAGSVKDFAEPLLERGISVFSAAAANAIPVAEYTLSQVLFSLKQGWLHHRHLRENPGPNGWRPLPITGVYGARVGIISLGLIGSKVCELLRPFELILHAYDPYVSAESMRSQNIIPTTLKELFATSDVVTVHTPWLKETDGLITGKLLRSMKRNATFINTSRGALVREGEMIEVLTERPDLTAILDVTRSEPPEVGSPLYTLPNVVMTPHIAGSKGAEVHRLADWMMDECESWLSGRSLKYEITKESLEKMA